MECPRCSIEQGDAGPYRDAAPRHHRHQPLERVAHAAGVELDRCPTCGGVFLDHGEIQRVQQKAADGPKGRAGELAQRVTQRAYENARRPPHASPRCPSCGEEMFEREWAYGSQLLADVCVGCRGVWLDGDELEQLEAWYAG